MKNIKILLLFLLLVSFAVNIYQYTTCKSSLTEPGPTDDSCFVTAPYSGAIEIDNSSARAFYEQFVSSLVSPDSTTGGIISRKAFEEMLCLENCNGIAYTFARDKDGKTGPGANGVFVIFEGVNVKYEEPTNTVVSVTAIPDARKYRSGSWCPPSCMLW